MIARNKAIIILQKVTLTAAAACDSKTNSRYQLKNKTNTKVNKQTKNNNKKANKQKKTISDQK